MARTHTAWNRTVAMRLIYGMALLAITLFSQNQLASAADSRLQILNFSMEKCEPCKAMQPVLAKLIMDGWQIREIDVVAEPKLVAQYQLKSAPTLVVLAGGRELDRVVGTIAYNKLLARLEAASRAVQSASAAQSHGQLSAQAAPRSRAANDPSSPAHLSATQPMITAPEPLPQRPFDSMSSMNSPRADAPIVRGQSPGPADIASSDIDNDRMLEFIKDLPDPPKLSPGNVSPATLSLPSSSNQPANFQLASSSANIGRASVGPAPVMPAAAASAPGMDPGLRAQLATVRIKVEDANTLAYGTGTVIYVHNQQALVLTCGHMFRDIGANAQMSVDVFDRNGRLTNVPAQVVSHSTEQGDIGLMEFRCPFPITRCRFRKRLQPLVMWPSAMVVIMAPIQLAAIQRSNGSIATLVQPTWRFTVHPWLVAAVVLCSMHRGKSSVCAMHRTLKMMKVFMPLCR